MDTEHGKYWDKGIQLTEGCTPCSPGCDHCWEASRSRWLLKGYTDRDGRFNGNVRIFPTRIDSISDRKKPTVWAVWNDLFHPAVSSRFVDDFIEMAEYCSRHTFLVLTKRANMLLEYHNRSDHESTDGSGNLETSNWEWPDNIYKGLTVCTQREYDEKMFDFIEVPGKKFLSIEPMLEGIDLTPPQYRDTNLNNDFWLEKLDAIVLGGETGRKARPANPAWVRSVRDRCRERTDMGRPWPLPFFFKGWGEWTQRGPASQGYPVVEGAKTIRLSMNGKDDQTDPESNGDACWMQRVGRKQAGRMLDGRTFDDLPWRNAG